VTAFEYTSVMASIILGLGLVDVMVSANRLIRAGKLVRWDWAAPVASVLVVLTLLQIWWSLYRPHDQPMTIGEFLPLFVELTLLFLLAAAALPDEVGPEGVDLKAYYDRNGPYFWALFTAALAWTLIMGAAPALMSGAILDALGDRLMDFGVVAVFASLIFIRKRWWHALAFVFLSVGPIGWLSKSLG